MTDIVKTFLPTKQGLTSPDLGHHLIVCKVIRTRNSGTPWLVGNSPVVGGGESRWRGRRRGRARGLCWARKDKARENPGHKTRNQLGPRKIKSLPNLCQIHTPEKTRPNLDRDPVWPTNEASPRPEPTRHPRAPQPPIHR